MMLETSLLQLIIPEFEALYCFAPKSRYHFYTTDEHTLLAIGRIERLATGRGVDALHRTISRMPNMENLLLALLLHDIAKPAETKEAEHVEQGALIAENVLSGLGFSGDIRRVSGLVKQHLILEQYAFRRDSTRRETIESFCEIIGSRDFLDELYLLTYADLAAVRAGVWSEWKQALLTEFYLKSVDLLDGRTGEPEIKKEPVVDPELYALAGKKRVEQHLGGLPGRYGLEFDSREIATHIDMGERIKDRKASLTCSNLITFSELTIVTSDREFLLSDICGIFSVNNVSIFEARIFTHEKGLVIDSFRVVDNERQGPLGSHVAEDIESDLRKVLAGEATLPDMLEKHSRRWKWKSGGEAVIPLDIKFEESEHHSIIDITGPDKIGLLYVVTRAISSLGLMIHSAKIATKVDGLIDSFYVTDAENRKIGVTIQKEEVESKIKESVDRYLNSGSLSI